ncbi:hypothetical protein L2E82_10328 [Cichorium intybus]|uniref:Uncharacterized protein n=1 Tax=Cichorium intybus TaxID=13427 RepID=A0ACB9GBB9_CICIN|nr:hypothetical protein L2E82_10328 [Cichorium intybus]
MTHLCTSIMMATPLASAHDHELLRLLSRICNKEKISIGYSFSKDFWKRFADLLSTKVDHKISSSECIRAAKYHNIIYDGTPEAIRHPTMQNAEYRTLLHSIYLKVPRLLYPSESGTGSGGPIRSRSSKTCSTSSGMRREDWTDEWKALEPKLSQIAWNAVFQHHVAPSPSEKHDHNETQPCK